MFDSIENESEQIELLNDFLKIKISDNRLEAYLLMKKMPSEPIPSKLIQKFIKLNNIKFGLIEKIFESNFFNIEKLLSEPLIIACGTPPKYPINASIIILFESYPTKVGTLKNRGTIDYKDRGKIPHVKTGDIIAKKTPPVYGKNGIDIFGNEIHVEKPVDIDLKCARGVKISNDKLKAIAQIDGMPHIDQRSVITVLPELHIKGNVDLATGHILFDGAVFVRGSVNPGFQVKALSLVAEEIVKAEVQTTADIIVSGGIIGSSIKSGGLVKAKYINTSNIICLREVIAIKEIFDSYIYSEGKTIIENGSILSSRIFSNDGITACKIGSPVSKTCVINVGIDSKILNRFKNEIEKKNLESDKLEQSKNINREIKVYESIVGAKIKTTDKIDARSIRLSKIQAIDNVKVSKEIHDSKIETINQCIIPDGSIIASQIIAYQGIVANEIKDEKGHNSKLIVGINRSGEKKLKILKQEFHKCQLVFDEMKNSDLNVRKKLEKTEQKISLLNRIKDRLEIIKPSIEKKINSFCTKGDRSKVSKMKMARERIFHKYNQVIDELNQFLKIREQLISDVPKYDEIIQKKSKILKILEEKIIFYSKWVTNKNPKPVVKVFRDILKGTIITTPDSSIELNKSYQNVTIFENEILKDDIVHKEINIKAD